MSDNFDALKDNEFSVSEEGLEMVSGGYDGPCFVYIVKKGDSLTNIAARFHTTEDILTEINKIKNQNAIYSGHKLLIPDRS